MLLIPVQGEPDGIRYVPWMTWAIVAVNVLVFVQLGLTDRPADPAAIASAESAIVAHVSAHPDVVVPPEVERELTPEGRAALSKARAGIASPKATAEPDQIAARAEMERLSRRFIALVFGATGHHGFVPAHPTLEQALSSLFIHVGLVHLLGNLMFFLAVAPARRRGSFGTRLGIRGRPPRRGRHRVDAARTRRKGGTAPKAGPSGHDLPLAGRTARAPPPAGLPARRDPARRVGIEASDPAPAGASLTLRRPRPYFNIGMYEPSELTWSFRTPYATQRDVPEIRSTRA